MKLLTIGTFILLMVTYPPHIQAQTACLDLFKGLSSTEITETQRIERRIAELEDQYSRFNNSRWHTTIFSALRKLSGNSLESAVRQMRINLGNRFYRLMRAGDTQRATNYVRDIMSPLRASAEITFWAREMILELEERQTSPSVSREQQAQINSWIAKLQKVIHREVRAFRRYGDAQMIVGQLLRLQKMYDTQIDSRLRQFATEEAASRVLTESAPELTAQQRIGQELGLTPEQIETYVNGRITEVASKMYGLHGLRSMFPQLFREIPNSEKTYEKPILEKIEREMDFISMVYNGISPTGKRVYGSELPLIQTKKREIGWELLASVRNLISKMFSGYLAIIRVLDRNNTDSISATLSQVTGGKSVSEALGRFKAFSTSTRKVLDALIRDIAIYEAIHLHAAKVDVIEGLLQKYQQGLESREAFVEALRSLMTGPEGADVAKSFARIIEYNDKVNHAIVALEETIKDVEKQFPNNANASSAYKNTLKLIKEAQEAVANGTISEISLNSEPNLVSLAAKQTFVFSGATSMTVGGILYMVSPETFKALTEFLGRSLPF